MQNYQNKLGGGSYGNYGQGTFVQQLPEPQRITYSNFSGGLDTRDSREDTPPNSSPNALDVEVTMRDRLRPVPGVSLTEELARSSDQLVLHASLEYTSELVMFDPPFIGIKTGNTTQWYDVGLPQANRKFGYVNFGGTLLFSNGKTGLYAKEAGKSEVKLVESGPAAHTLASFAGRVFAGASIIGGNREPLGISWSGASSNHEEWDLLNEDGVQTGAGFELLIDDMAQGNYIVALRTMGLDFMAILLRNSIWIGRRTAQRARPADFQPRVVGVGAVNEGSCVVTRFGVVHLHDSGVYLFDGNNSNLISEQINSELLPLDKSQLSLYSASYNPVTKLVYLFTPSCTWVYDLERQRWHKRSLVARSASLFAPQIAAKTWAELTGTWAQQDEVWEDYKAKETELPVYLFLDTTGSRLGAEDDSAGANFDIPAEPYVDFLSGVGPHGLTQLLIVKEILVKHFGGGRVGYEFFSTDEELVPFAEKRLRDVQTGTAVTKLERAAFTTGMRLRFLEGKPEVARVELAVLPAGRRIERPIQPVMSLTDDGTLVVGHFTDFSNFTTGAQPIGWQKGWSGLSLPGTWSVEEDTGATGGKVLRFVSSAAVTGGDHLLAWVDAGLGTDMEFVVRFRASSGFFAGNICSEVGTQEFSYTSELTGSLFRTFERAGSSSSNWLQSSTFNLAANTYCWVIIRREGSTFMGKRWTGTEADEPSSWTHSAVDTTPRPAGYAGVSIDPGSLGGRTLTVDLVGVAFDGARAPKKAPLPGWIVPPTGYHIRISGIGSGFKFRAGGVIFVPAGDTVLIDLASAPSTIELLDSTDTVLASIAAPATRKSYTFGLTYS